MEKKRNLWLIPTDKPSRLFKFANQLHLDTIPKEYYKKYNIYITNSEEIKEGDWYLVELFKITGESDGFHIEKCTKLDDVWCNNFDVISTRHKDNCKKIILTTDQDLIKDGVQAIDDEFLEWFVKNPSCESVRVNNLCYGALGGFADAGYKIIIPKEEHNPFELPKALPDDVFYQSLEEPKQQTDEKGNLLTYWGGLEQAKEMEMLQMVGKIQMTKRYWWEFYKKNWYKHTDLWGGLWWIRFKWNKEDETFKNK